jgi:hypothetical protein
MNLETVFERSLALRVHTRLVVRLKIRNVSAVRWRDAIDRELPAWERTGSE